MDKNKKLLIWFCGTAEMKNPAKANLTALKEKHPDHKIKVIDGIATPANEKKTNIMKNKKGFLGAAKRKVGNATLNFGGVTNKFLSGYKETTHLVQLNEALKAINDHINSGETKGKKTDLIVGGFSRGAALALPAFLGSLVEASKQREIQPKEVNGEQIVDGGINFKEHFKKISVIAVDPVPGINEQDTFGLDKIKNKNPLGEIFQTLGELDIPIDVTWMPSNYDMLNGLAGCQKWNELANNIPEGIDFKIHQAGTNHLAMTLPFSDHRYEKRATPRKLLNRVIQEKLETVPENAMPLQEMQDKITKKDSHILRDIALGTKTPLKKELLATVSRGVLRTLGHLGGRQGQAIKLGNELKEQLKDPGKPKIIGGRPIDAVTLGFELNNKGKLTVSAEKANKKEDTNSQETPDQKVDYKSMNKTQIKREQVDNLKPKKTQEKTQNTSPKIRL